MAVRVRVAKRPASEIGLGPDRCVLCVVWVPRQALAVVGWLVGWLVCGAEEEEEEAEAPHSHYYHWARPDTYYTQSVPLTTAFAPITRRTKPWAGELPRVADAVVAVPGQVMTGTRSDGDLWEGVWPDCLKMETLSSIDRPGGVAIHSLVDRSIVRPLCISHHTHP
jgi:hypothetical protein